MNSSTLLRILNFLNEKVSISYFPLFLIFLSLFTTDNMTWFDYLPELSPVTTLAASHIVNVIKNEMTSTIINILSYVL